MIADGRAALAGDPHASARGSTREIAAGKGSDTSIILYTSGTTGQSKGVVLSAKGCIDAARDTVAFDKLTEQDEALAYLPLAWVGDHYLNYAQALVAGFCIACPESADTAMQDLREIGPTFYFAPPRIFEQMLTRVMIRMEDAGFIKRTLFHYFIGVARRHGEAILNGSRCRSPAGCSTRSASSWSTGRSRTCSACRACASPTPRARRSGPTCSRSTARSA